MKIYIFICFMLFISKLGATSERIEGHSLSKIISAISIPEDHITYGSCTKISDTVFLSILHLVPNKFDFRFEKKIVLEGKTCKQDSVKEEKIYRSKQEQNKRAGFDSCLVFRINNKKFFIIEKCESGFIAYRAKAWRKINPCETSLADVESYDCAVLIFLANPMINFSNVNVEKPQSVTFGEIGVIKRLKLQIEFAMPVRNQNRKLANFDQAMWKLNEVFCMHKSKLQKVLLKVHPFV